MKERKRQRIKRIVLTHLGANSPPERRRKRRKVVLYVAYNILGLETEEGRLDESYKSREKNDGKDEIYWQLMQQLSKE
jgi:hypothetical protein